LEAERLVEIGGKQWLYVWTSKYTLAQAASPLDDSVWIVPLGLLTSTGLFPAIARAEG
jgi:hypothetical protein